jgi:hypothetical protein
MAATLRQLETIDRLVAELGLEGPIKDQVYAIAKLPEASPQRGGPISDLIDGLIAKSRARRVARPAAPTAEPGYYVRADGEAICVVTNKAGTYTYGKRFVPNPSGSGRPSWEYERGLGISVAELEPMTARAAAALGLAHGYCIKCLKELGGASLSAAVSAKIGYGETCARNLGWYYPTGVADQRAYLDGSIT